LDEPTTGLDPGVRSDFWKYLAHLRQVSQITVVVTTHLLEEADRADRMAILDQGRLVALGTPPELRSSVGGDTLAIECQGDVQQVAAILRDELQLPATVVDHWVRLESPEAGSLVPQILARLGDRVRSLTVGRPSLEDVFIAKTGHQFWGAPGQERER
jgi:ABC-2 type transport system ATP-binding protein